MNENGKPHRPRGDRKYLILFTVQIKIAALHRLCNPCDIPIAIRVSKVKKKAFFVFLPFFTFKLNPILVSDFALGCHR